MKKILLVTLALGLAGAQSLMATVDVYITGSTAFRASVYSACQKLFVGGAPNTYYGDAAHGGADSGFSAKTASWVMTGTPLNEITNLSGQTLVVHGLFTGSIQGVQTVEQSVKLGFAQPVGTVGGLCTSYITNTPTIGFSDADSASCPYPAIGNYLQEDVAVQPFVVCKSQGSGDVATYVNNITWEQLAYGIPQGRIPVSAWSNKDGADRTNKFIYLCQRTLDSGTRRVHTAEQYFAYGDQVGIYIYDITNKFFYQPTVLTNTSVGQSPYGVVGPAGVGGVNLNWGYGYVGGGDIASALNHADAQNQSIGYLSFADAKSVGTGNWANVISYNGMWPTAAGAGIHNVPNNTTNDFSPITTGYYPCWGAEILVHIIDPSQAGDQNITQYQLGDNTIPGSFMGVFNAQTLIFTNLTSPLVGSIENEIELSKPTGATAIRLSDMRSSRGSVGGPIAPF